LAASELIPGVRDAQLRDPLSDRFTDIRLGYSPANWGEDDTFIGYCVRFGVVFLRAINLSHSSCKR